ncbi:MAG: hypothetical protein J3K34DRAFT_521079 [Monoraphidium minutum]|nr:MAG: hypothetical protein J3K34DRAFT_521079 [Monoraphidium minutum]
MASRFRLAIGDELGTPNDGTSTPYYGVSATMNEEEPPFLEVRALYYKDGQVQDSTYPATNTDIYAVSVQITTCEAKPTPEPTNGVWPAGCANTASGGKCTAVCNAPEYEGTVETNCTNGYWGIVTGECTLADGGSDPHLSGFFGQKYEFCGADLPECKGHAFSIISEAKLQVNAEVDRLAGADEWPSAGTWITGLGLKASDIMSIELRMRKDVPYTIVPYLEKTRALRPEGAAPGAAGLRVLLAAVIVNGQDVLGNEDEEVECKIGSGETLEFGNGHTVHFPSNTHPNDPTDGPVMVINTPDSVWTWYLESEDTWHLDFKVGLKDTTAIKAMHGLLGQSLHWGPNGKAVVEGHDLAYVVEGGLMGTDFKYSLFGKRAAPARRALNAPEAGILLAGTPAAVAASD